MVATLLRIRFRVLGNTLARSPWQLVGYVLNGLMAIGALLLIAVGLFFAGMGGADIARVSVIVGGAILTLGWVFGPILLAGIDTSLDTAKLAQFPLTTGRMMLALTVAGLTGIAGAAAILGGIATFAAWWRWPLAALAAVVSVPLGVLVCVLASRTVTSLAAGLGGRRRTQEVIGIIAFAALVLAGPILFGLQRLLGSAVDSGARLESLVDGVSWTPIAAAWAVPGDIATGAYVPALLKALIAAATIVVLWLLWRRSLQSALVSPARSAARTVKAGSLGWFGRMPVGGVGATWARSLTYWLRDSRFLVQLLTGPLIPVVILVYTAGNPRTGFFSGSAIFTGFLLGIAPYTILSYDGTTFATVLQTGIRGVADRFGRILGAASLGLPLVVLVAIVTIAISGQWPYLPAVLGAAIGMLLTAYGLSAVSSALLVIPVAAPGDNPFKRVPGTTFAMGLMFMGLSVGAVVLASPGIVLAILAFVLDSTLYTWLAFAVGTVLGIALCAVGILVGGRIFDRTAPSLLARLKAFKGA